MGALCLVPVLPEQLPAGMSLPRVWGRGDIAHCTTQHGVTRISQPVHWTCLLLGLVQVSNQITSKAILSNVTSESSEPLILLCCVIKYILKRSDSFCNR